MIKVVVIWRPLEKKKKKKRKVVIPPKIIYDIAEIFEVEDRLPKKPEAEPEAKPMPLEIRAFDKVPMANILAVMPKTKLMFRPADAFIFDLVSVFSLSAILASQRFDSPKLDLIAIVSVSFWIFRTFIRYSNKLARYDLLVNKFLTSKIAHKNTGALKFITNEAGKQRATRAALVHTWLQSQHEEAISSVEGELLRREDIIRNGFVGVNQLLRTDRLTHINIGLALDDLEEMNLIQFSDGGEKLLEVKDAPSAKHVLKSIWMNLFEN